MSEFAKIKSDYKMATEAFNGGFGKLKTEFEEQMVKENGSLTSIQIKEQDVDFSLYFCLMETIEQCDRKIKEKPSRELALAKTKLQEAKFWLDEA